MKESNIQTLFSKVVPLDQSAVYELKIEKGKSFAFKRVADHQVASLLKAESSPGLFYKIQDFPYLPDTGRTVFAAKKPFDCFVVSRVKAYVGICFYQPRKKKELLLIRINDFVNWRDAIPRKSLPENVARQLAEKIICL